MPRKKSKMMSKKMISKKMISKKKMSKKKMSKKNVKRKSKKSTCKKKKIKTVMHEFKYKKLRSSSGKKVINRKQAIAIALSMANKYC